MSACWGKVDTAQMPQQCPLLAQGNFTAHVCFRPKADMTGSTLIGRPIVSIARSVPGFFGFTSNAPLAKKNVRPNVATAEILEA